ncbi:MAG: isoprenylcysteine carboxylmethyltransferase family protein [Pirellulaceae bacterium]|nr:isoprenylcysteine carboxylmethyltransferase family protein [Pirellulaceae bacterium]
MQKFKRISFLVYGVTCHLMFLGVYAWLALFIGNLGFGLITTVDGEPGIPFGWATVINTCLVLAFVVPHSVMARPAFKRWWTRFVPKPIERSTYVLVSNLLMINLLWNWQPMGGVIWNITNPVGRGIMYGLFLLGVLLVPVVSLMISHFDLFGTRQVWLYFRGREYQHLPFRTPLAYRFVRHPLYLGWMLFFWAAPTMTVAHLLFAGLTTAYMLAAIPIEERDLVDHFGEKYLKYRHQVGALIPRIRDEQAEDGLFAKPERKI